MVDSDPSWYGAVLAKHDRDNSVVQVLSLDSEPATKVGENYASVILRVTLKVVLGSGKVTTKKVILKKNISDIPKEINASGAFCLEGIIYEKILGTYENMISDNGVLYSKFWPDCLLADHTMIMFEDLKASGFTLGKRQTGLDFEHAKLVFANLARMHSLSVVAEAKGMIYPKMLPPYMMIQTGPTEIYFRTSMKWLSDVIHDQWGPEWSVVENRIRYLMDRIFPTIRNLYEEPHKLSVVNHGDCWVNNMMFKYGVNDSPTEMKFFDFQGSYYNSYAWDLTYFLHTSVHPEYLSTCQDNLVEIYNKEFINNLERFDFETSVAPSIEDINEELERLQMFGLAVTTTILPVTSNPSDIQINLKEMLNEDCTTFKELFEDKKFENTLQAIFQHFINKGVFS